ncbi:aspartate aminotransferase family protein [Rubripirellula reticaptiva]|uniref:5-aminovalerate aminotransferase DavT n=1 Tax=Rubripirellula reticaptiva TaxID=2528013 RepID=A0A5C6EGW5_9BACT|nr:aspartate aminotransferase family protein [Rubripirellula reticaptiva]TWU48048.1 5-aminovalerate aminotransferase DavT [Rubripirellula reticaptiva]
MATDADLIARRAAVTPRGISMATSLIADSSSGAVLRDPSGREVIDFGGGIGVMNVGHCQPKVVKAITDQANRLLHSCFQVATYEPYVALCEKLAEILPHVDVTKLAGDACTGHTKTMLVNTGAEAVENAIKIARQATNRSAVICFTDGFHGRSMMAMSLTSKFGYKIGCGPYAPEVYRLPFPNHYRYGDGLGEAQFVERELNRFRESLINTVAAEQVAAVILEPIQGEGGFVPAPLAYLQGLRELCDENGILLILDEVQSGFCRTGRWAAYEHYDILPDISTWAKSMGGGLPIGAVMGRSEIMDAARLGTIGGTYGGNPVSCAASLATIKLMEELNLNARATEIGNTMFARLRELQGRFPDYIGDVRGRGAMVGVELVNNGNPKSPATELTSRVLKASMLRDVLILRAGIHGNVIRFLMPLVISDQQLNDGLDIVTEEIAKAIQNP